MHSFKFTTSKIENKRCTYIWFRKLQQFWNIICPPPPTTTTITTIYNDLYKLVKQLNAADNKPRRQNFKRIIFIYSGLLLFDLVKGIPHLRLLLRSNAGISFPSRFCVFHHHFQYRMRSTTDRSGWENFKNMWLKINSLSFCLFLFDFEFFYNKSL